MSKYTKGKWEVRKSMQQRLEIIGGNKIIAEVIVYEFPETLANAHLIASAPELLQQCKNTLRQLEQVYVKGDPKTEGLCLSIIGLKAVISQAEPK